MNNLIRHFYSWYTFPLCFLHEYLHKLGCIITNTKVNKLSFYKTESGLYNGELDNEQPVDILNLYVIVYFPTLLIIIPLILSFFFIIAWYVLLYVISTAIFQNGKIIWMALPSQKDIDYIKYWKYSRNLLLKFIKEEELNESIKNNTYNELLKKYDI
ncbi:hypothetical protein M0Q50_09990 [bacterium]|jgi:hypothetical protein|nr:hypothetical protein [bacterium]